MKQKIRIIPFFLFLALMISGMPEDGLAAEEKAAFTPADSLRIKSFSADAVTGNGRWIAGTISDRMSRLGTDYKRYGDPNYISPRKVEFVLMNTETGARTSLFSEPVQVQSAVWSEDGKTLAFLKRSGNVFELMIYSTKNKRTKNMTLKTQKAIASNSFLIWAHDNRRIILTLRAVNWAEKGRDMFKEAAVGPITVYDSSEPFLKWDKIRNHSGLAIPAVVDTTTGRVEELLPEGHYGQIRLSENDTFLTYVQSHPLKTSYSREGGEEYELMRLDLKDRLNPRILIKRDKKRLRLSWNKINTLFAWEDEGDIFLQSVDETEARNLTKDKIKPEKEQATDKDKADTRDEAEIKKRKKRSNSASNDSVLTAPDCWPGRKRVSGSSITLRTNWKWCTNSPRNRKKAVRTSKNRTSRPGPPIAVSST
ncbi:MAG: hypothetical protein MUP70_14390 [Candidatus Aminicenantes bacterium]|nr:hypothetical protein [Candidatus Aminicenantes bacterium]